MDIKTMAQKAGVSVATISRAMNPDTRSLVAEKTLKKIDALVKKHGYSPNLAAKNLRQTSTRTIGVVFAYLPGIFYSSYYAHILSGVSDFLFDQEYQFKVILLKESFQELENYDLKAAERVDGLIVTHWFKYFNRKLLLERLNIPFVIINDIDKDLGCYFVGSNQVEAGRAAAEYLYYKGHRKFGILSGPVWSVDSTQRIEGFKSFLNEKNITVEDQYCIEGNYIESDAYEKAQTFVKSREELSAIFCCNDQMAMGVIRRMQEEGLNCPDDISVLGFDNDIFSQFHNPAISTIDIPIYNIAQEATKRLLAHLQNPSPGPFQGVSYLPYKLIERQTVRNISA